MSTLLRRRFGVTVALSMIVAEVRASLHPLPIVVFLVLVTAMVGLFAARRPVQTLTGAPIVAHDIPVSFLLIPRSRRIDAASASRLETTRSTWSTR